MRDKGVAPTVFWTYPKNWMEYNLLDFFALNAVCMDWALAASGAGSEPAFSGPTVPPEPGLSPRK